MKKRINAYKIDPILSERFKWLAKNDSTLQQNLQNHFLKLERKLMDEVSIARIRSVVDQFTESPETTIELKQTFEIAKHQIQFVFHKQADGITETPPTPPTPPISFWGTNLGLATQCFLFALGCALLGTCSS